MTRTVLPSKKDWASAGRPPSEASTMKVVDSASSQLCMWPSLEVGMPPG